MIMAKNLRVSLPLGIIVLLATACFATNFEKFNSEEEGVVIHLILTKFKDDTTPERIQEIIKTYANLVNLVPSMKSFRWGKDVSTENLNQGFTLVFEATFESTQGIAEFRAHPAHAEAVKSILPYVEKFIEMDYKPTIVKQFDSSR